MRLGRSFGSGFEQIEGHIGHIVGDTSVSASSLVLVSLSRAKLL